MVCSSSHGLSAARPILPTWVIFDAYAHPDSPSNITGILVEAAGDLPEGGIRAALLFHRAGLTVRLAGSVNDGVGLCDVATRVSEWTPVAPQ